MKAVIIESANRTVQNILYKLMESYGSWRWISFLKQTEDIYNGRVHSSLHGLTPLIAHQPENEERLRALYLQDYKRHKQQFVNQKPYFQPGDTVRIRNERTTFTRGYTAGFGKDFHVVESIRATYPFTYKISGKRKFFYANELTRARQPVTPADKQYYIAATRVVKKKKLRSGREVGGEKQYHLKSKNQDTSSWITEREYQALQKDGYL